MLKKACLPPSLGHTPVQLQFPGRFQLAYDGWGVEPHTLDLSWREPVDFFYSHVYGDDQGAFSEVGPSTCVWAGLRGRGAVVVQWRLWRRTRGWSCFIVQLRHPDAGSDYAPR